MKSQLTALYHDTKDAEGAVNALTAAGFDTKDISLVAAEGLASKLGLDDRTKAPKGAIAGGVVGGAIGALVALVATAATAGIGILATGPILMALAGLGTGGVVGGLAGALAGAGVPDHEAKFYEREIRERDAILIGVAIAKPDDETKAKDILDRFHPARVSEAA